MLLGKVASGASATKENKNCLIIFGASEFNLKDILHHPVKQNICPVIRF